MHAGGTNIPVYQKKERKCTAARRISKDQTDTLRRSRTRASPVQSTVYFSTAPAAGRRSPIPWAGGGRGDRIDSRWPNLGSYCHWCQRTQEVFSFGGSDYCTYIRSRSFTRLRLPHHVTLFSVSQLPDDNTYVHLAPCSARVPQPLFFHHNRKSPLCRDFY